MPIELTPEEKSRIKSLLVQQKMCRTTSLENANKIEDKEHKDKVVKSLRVELKEIETLQEKLTNFNA